MRETGGDSDLERPVHSPGESLVKTRQRVIDHGEVFTPSWLVEDMLNLVKNESERIDSRFLEPACGSGNFLVPVLGRKLATVEKRYGSNPFERDQYALLALMCIYGIELLEDNVKECRVNLLERFKSTLHLGGEAPLVRAAAAVVEVNIVQGDALSMTTTEGEPITFAEWGYLGKGRFQRRDFRFDTLTAMSELAAEDSLFASLGAHEVFTPVKTYDPMTVSGIGA